MEHQGAPRCALVTLHTSAQARRDKTRILLQHLLAFDPRNGELR